MRDLDPNADRLERKLHRLPPAIYANTKYEFFFTVCARQQGTPFLNAAISAEVIESLLWTRRRYGWLLFCYCLMPDHLHFVCRLTREQVRLVNTGVHGIKSKACSTSSRASRALRRHNLGSME